MWLVRLISDDLLFLLPSISKNLPKVSVLSTIIMAPQLDAAQRILIETLLKKERI